MHQSIAALIRSGLIAVLLLLATSTGMAGNRSMWGHMRIQSSPKHDAALASLPSIRIESITASVPLDDRLKANEAFDRPFAEALRDGMTWYLKERGLRVVEEAEDLRLEGKISTYEGFKGWGHWGVNLSLEMKAFQGGNLVRTLPLRSFLKYKSDDDVRDEEMPKYRSLNLKVTFDEVLFTRIGIDLCEKLIEAMKEAPAPPSTGSSFAGAGITPPPAGAMGSITVDSSAPESELFIDGVRVGTTPIFNYKLSAASHDVELRKDGFETWKRRVLIQEGANTRFVVDLTPAPKN